MDVVRAIEVVNGRQLFIRVAQEVVRYVRLHNNSLLCSRGSLTFDHRQEYTEMEEYYSA